MDPTRVPCPADRYRSDRVTYYTNSREVPPASDSDFTAFDDGNASPRFVRSTLYAVPSSADLLKKSSLPFSLVVTPLGKPAPGERLVPFVDSGEAGPMRCIRCMAYPCQALVWQNGGRNFQCPICENSTPVPEAYFSPLLPNGRRMDADARPELYSGSVDYGVGPIFRNADRKLPLPLAHVYLIDVSFGAQKTGVMQTAIAALRSVVEHLDETQNHHLALMTYSNTVHCYDCSAGLSRPKMLVVASDDAFALPGGLIVAAKGQGKKNLLAALDALPSLHDGASMRQESDLVRAVRAANSLLTGRGGRAVAIVAANPTSIEDRLRALATKNVVGTDEEKVLYDVDASNVVWKELCGLLVSNAVSLDMFVATSNYVDMGTLQWVTLRTAGRIHYYPDVTPGAYELKFQEELRGRQTRQQGYDAVVRVRCSKGVVATGYRGAFTNDRVSDELEMCALDETSTLVVNLAVEGTITSPNAVVQIATLYTTAQGQRCVRLHTLILTVATEISSIFRLADLDATVYWTASTGAALGASNGVKYARGEVAKRTGEMLAAYRQHCAKSPAPGQLILPEALKSLPAYVLGLLKSVLMRPSTSISPHQRCFFLRCLLPFTLPGPLLRVCYPKAIPLDEISSDSPVFGFPDPNSGMIRHPAPLRLLRSSLVPACVTLFDDGLSLRIFFGSETVGRPAMAELITEPWAQPEVDVRACPWDAMPRESEWAQRVAAVVASQRALDPAQFKNVRLCKAGDPDEAALINATLIEDAISSSMSLTGFLKHLHQKITNSS